MQTLLATWRQLTAAPHRMFFASGLAWLLAFSGWWGLVVTARAWGGSAEPRMPGLVLHAATMLFGVFTPFFLGFLFTVFPRWMPAPDVGRPVKLTIFGLLNAGNLLVLAGLYGPRYWLAGGWALVATAIGMAGACLARALFASRERALQAPPVVLAFLVGTTAASGLAISVITGDFRAWPWIRTAGLWGYLLPVYFAVCHRMIPFFTSRVITDYKVWRPAGVLWSFTALCLLRVGLEELPAWRWTASWPLAIIAAACAVRWAPRRRGPALMTALHVAFAWLVAGLVLTAGADLAAALGRPGILGRAPIHAMGMGFFGGMLLAMMTRVTLGHSGRSLAMDRRTWRLFVLVQLAAALRIAAELAPAAAGWLSVGAAAAWVAAFGGWAVRYAMTWFRPRVDGRPG